MATGRLILRSILSVCAVKILLPPAQRWSSGIPGGTDSTNYLFFSIPFEVSNAKSAITTVMGPPDEFNYRLYAYNNGWQENPSSVTMGNAYFFIFDPDKYPDNPNHQF